MLAVPARPALLTWIVTRLLVVLSLLPQTSAGDGVMGLTHGWVRTMLDGQSPYNETGVAYPPLAMFLFIAAGVSIDTPTAYSVTFAVLVLIIDALGLSIAAAAERDGQPHAALAYTLSVALVGPILLLWRYDLWPALAHLAAGALLLRGRRTASWLALGVGIALKPYLLVVLPLWAVWTWRSARAPVPEIGRGVLLAAAPTVVAGVLMLPLAGTALALPYAFQADRGINVESTAGAVLAEGDDMAEAVFAAGCLCWEREAANADAVGRIAQLITVAGLGVLTVLVAARPSRDRLVALSAGAVVLLLIASPVFSPQYVVWPLPALALLRRKAALGFASAAAVIASYGYPQRFGHLIAYDGFGRSLVVGRNAALLVALAILVLQRYDDEVASGQLEVLTQARGTTSSS
jgi:hypothetical protein